MPTRKMTETDYLTKAFLQSSLDTAMLFAPCGCTHSLSPVPPFLLTHNEAESLMMSCEVIGQEKVKLQPLLQYQEKHHSNLNHLLHLHHFCPTRKKVATTVSVYFPPRYIYTRYNHLHNS